jgi:hypothetical protein
MPIARNTWRYALILAIVVAAGVLAMFATGGPASAKEPNTHASCMGQEAASISPPGSSGEVPGGMPELMQFFRSLPGSPGSTVKFVASLHEGSHEDCDAAIEG